MNVLPGQEIPAEFLGDSVLSRIAAAYFAVGKKMERKTQCSATRGLILSTLRDGAALNQNRVATILGLDRTVVHRAIKSLVRDALATEHRGTSGRAIQIQLTDEGRKYRERLISARKAADDSVRRQMTEEERATLLRLLRQVAECEF